VEAADAGWVVLARIVRPRGRRGELLADLLTDFPESFAQRKRLFLRPENELSLEPPREVRLEAYWRSKERVVLKFAGIDSIDDAEKLRGSEVVIPIAERMPLGDDAVYISDLLGVRIIDVSRENPQDAGEILDVLPAGPGPAMLVVRCGSSPPALIPFVKAYLRRIDLAAKRIEMALPEGLLAIDAPLTAEERQRMRAESQKNASEAE
jgi:16S rRNA processing protein RimM